MLRLVNINNEDKTNSEMSELVDSGNETDPEMPELVDSGNETDPEMPELVINTRGWDVLVPSERNSPSSSLEPIIKDDNGYGCINYQDFDKNELENLKLKEENTKLKKAYDVDIASLKKEIYKLREEKEKIYKILATNTNELSKLETELLVSQNRVEYLEKRSHKKTGVKKIQSQINDLDNKFMSDWFGTCSSDDIS